MKCCGKPMFEVFYGDDLTRFRCMSCLKPCPFCKGEEIRYDCEIGAFWCRECGADGPQANTEEEARALWNRRVSD